MSASPSNRIRELRTLQGLSQKELADRINDLAREAGQGAATSPDTVGRWERGENPPQPMHQRLLAQALNATVQELQFDQPIRPLHPNPSGDYIDVVAPDPRVKHSQDEWQHTRNALNAQRHALSQVAVRLYPEAYWLGSTGLITRPDWLPAAPVDLSAIELEYQQHSPSPASELDGQEIDASYARPMQSLNRRYARYTQAVRDLAKPRLFENRYCWRLIDVSWGADKGEMSFGDTTYFASCDVFETAAHELAYVVRTPARAAGPV